MLPGALDNIKSTIMLSLRPESTGSRGIGPDPTWGLTYYQQDHKNYEFHNDLTRNGYPDSEKIPARFARRDSSRRAAADNIKSTIMLGHEPRSAHQSGQEGSLMTLGSLLR